VEKHKRKIEPISIKGVRKRGKNPHINFDPRDPDPKKIERSLKEKAINSDLPFELLREVWERGLSDYITSKVETVKPDITPYQWAFARVNSFIAGGRALELDEDLVCEAKSYKITKQTSNKSLGRLARRKDALGAQARAELASRRSHVYGSKKEASRTLGDVLHGKAKMDHSTAKKIIRTLGMNPKSAAAKTLTAHGRAYEQKQAHNKLRRQITKEVTAKLKKNQAKSNADLLDVLKKVQATFNAPVSSPKPPHAPVTHAVASLSLTRPTDYNTPNPTPMPLNAPRPKPERRLRHLADIKADPDGPFKHLPRRNESPPVATGVMKKLTSLIRRK